MGSLRLGGLRDGLTGTQVKAMSKVKSPRHYDGKKVGAASSVKALTDVLPGPRRFASLRRRRFYGDIEATQRLRMHMLKWLRRGMSIDRVAQKLGVSWREVATVRHGPFDPTPRLERKK
jgi:hypothetical protein